MPGIVRHRGSEAGVKSRDPFRAPDFAEPIRAWRAWYIVLHERTLRLRSLYFPLLWEPGSHVEAECRHRCLLRPWRRRTHEAPHQPCECGIYATTTLAGAAEYLRLMLPPAETIQYAVGRVSLWGVVIECERGWRAAFAYPAWLYVPARSTARPPPLRSPEVAEGLAGYGVPVTVTDVSTPSELVEAIELGELVAEEY